MTRPSVSKPAYPSIFALKAICAAMVVLIHMPSPGKEYVYPLLRIAVPVFFIISGYFTYSDSYHQTKDRIFRNLGKIIRITLFANCIYLVFTILTTILRGSDLPFFSLKFLSIWIFTGNGLAYGGHLWYLTAYIETLLVFGWLYKIHKEKILLYLTLPLIVLNITLGYIDLAGIATIPNFWRINFITIGIPCFCIGYMIRKFKSEIMQYLSPTRATLAVCGLLFLAYGEKLLVSRSGMYYPQSDIFVFTVPLAAMVFIWCLLHPSAGGGLEYIGKKYSLNIYLYHMLVYFTLLNIFRFFHIDIANYSYLLVLPCTLLFVLFLDKATVFLSRNFSSSAK